MEAIWALHKCTHRLARCIICMDDTSIIFKPMCLEDTITVDLMNLSILQSASSHLESLKRVRMRLINVATSISISRSISVF